MTAQRKIRNPRNVALGFAAFFLVYGVYAWFFTTHPAYATFSIILGVVWLAVAWLAGNMDKPGP